VGDGAVMRAQQPPLQQRGDLVDVRQQLGRRLALSLEKGDTVPVPVAPHGVVARPAVRVDVAARLDAVLHEAERARSRSIGERGLEELFNPSLSGCAQPNALRWQQQMVEGNATLALVCPAQDYKASAELELRLGQGEAVLGLGAAAFTAASFVFPALAPAAGAYMIATATLHAYLAFVVRPCQHGLACP
jgi:hypothetical protein